MKKLLFLPVLLFLCGNLNAQQLKGRVLNAFSEVPVENAIVQAENIRQTTTDQDGRFTLQTTNFPVQLRIFAAGYQNKKLLIQAPNEELLILLDPIAEPLSEVVLRSTIIPQELLQTPASVNVLTTEDLQRTDETNIVQSLNRVSGVYVHQGAMNTNKLSIRGVGARSQYSTNRVKAYFMEIPISTAEGETTLDDIDPAVIGRAEIIKGPASSVYGAGLGGVINLYPLEAEELGTTGRIKTTFGSFGLWKKTLQASLASENSGFTATYNNLKYDGWRDNSSYERNSFTVSGELESSENNSLSLLAQFTRLKAYIPSSLNKETFENEPESAAFTWAAAKGFESYDKGLVGFSYLQEFSKGFTNTSSIYMNFRNGYEPRPFNILKEEQVATGARTKFNLKMPFLEPSELSFGAEVYREWYNISTFENLYEEFPNIGSVAGNNLSNSKQDRHYYNIFAQWNLSLSEKLEMEAGVNFNSTSYELDDLYYSDEVDQSGGYQFDNILSPRLGAVYSLAPGKNMYASVSHGFSTPTVVETLTPEGLINTNLQPETGINYELGFKGNFLNNRLYFELAVFTIQVENLLVSERVGEDEYIGRNAGKTDHNGLEFLLNYNFQITSGISAHTFVNASFNDFEFDEFVEDEEDFSGNSLPAVPDKSINAGFNLKTTSGFALFGTYQHEGEMPLNDQNSLFTNSYDLVHLKASYSPNIWENWQTEVSAGINNVFDEHYAASIVPNSIGFGGAAPRYYYPGNPRNFFVGLTLGYEF